MKKWWQDALFELRLQMLQANFQTCFGNAQAYAFEDGVFTVCVYSAAQREMLQHRLARLILRELRAASAGQVQQVRFILRDELQPVDTKGPVSI